MNAKDRIPGKALTLAQKILRRIDVEQKVNTPMSIFKEELEKALLAQFNSGFKVGKNVAMSKMNTAMPSKN